MAINLAGADVYFATTNHVLHAIWAGFTDDDIRTGAIADALRRLTRLLGEELDDTTTTISDFPRQDVACYEYALYLLRGGFVANGEETTPKWILGNGDDDDTVRPAFTDEIPASVRAWLFDSPAGATTVQLVRGM